MSVFLKLSHFLELFIEGEPNYTVYKIILVRCLNLKYYLLDYTGYCENIIAMFIVLLIQLINNLKDR